MPRKGKKIIAAPEIKEEFTEITPEIAPEPQKVEVIPPVEVKTPPRPHIASLVQRCPQCQADGFKAGEKPRKCHNCGYIVGV